MSFIGLLQQFAATAVGIPYYVRGFNTGRFLEAAGLALDAQVETLYQGLKLSQPLETHSSGLATQSRDRRITVYPTEPLSSQRQRLSQWLQLHRQRGTHQGELRNLASYFLPAMPLMRIVHQDGAGGRATWHTLAADSTYSVTKTEPSNWDFDGVTSKWSRWWAIIYRDPLMAWLDAAEYDDGTEWDDGTLWDGGPSTAQIADIVGALKEAQGAHSQLWGAIVTTDPTSFDPTATATTDPDGWTSLPVGNWGSVIDHATGLPSRPPYASFIYDLGQG